MKKSINDISLQRARMMKTNEILTRIGRYNRAGEIIQASINARSKRKLSLFNTSHDEKR